ncbi:unnamed protein product [Phytophthora fragariaefolia]|uniref:Unnamed protein product n=1 Tax=Phytophthora fragariaefolia TaxID=1490495 RepID=A0A9W7CXZ1_9STRA|nr:unnamed protein product [Phytophthora fragariaefolia]
MSHEAYPSSRASAGRTCASGSSKWRRCAAFIVTTRPMTTKHFQQSPGQPWTTLSLGGSCFGRRGLQQKSRRGRSLPKTRSPTLKPPTIKPCCARSFVNCAKSMTSKPTYNGKYSALIVRVENMSEVDQVSYYGDGLKRVTQVYVKLQNMMTLSDAVDQAVKYEMSHFGGDRKVSREKPEREQLFRGKPSVNRAQGTKPFSKGSFKPAASVEEGPVVARTSEEDLIVNEATLNLLCEDPPVYNRAPLLAVDGYIVQSDKKLKAMFLLDCGATTVYVSRGFIKKYGLKTEVYSGRTIRVKLGDNKISESMLEFVKIDIQLKGVTNYHCVAVVFDIRDELDCVLGMPFVVDTSTSSRKCSQANGSGLHDAVDSKGFTTRSRDSCRAAVPERRRSAMWKLLKDQLET